MHSLLGCTFEKNPKDIKTLKLYCIIICVLITGAINQGQPRAQDLKSNPALDEKVRNFLAAHSRQWHDLNISGQDGQVLFDLIIKGNYKSALEIGTSTGLSEYIDARLADSHQRVKQLKGPFDFVFSDADKDWFKNYFIDVDPKLKIGGCYTTHNISDRSMSGYGRYGGRGGGGDSGDYLEFVKSLKNYETTLNRGILISYKRAESTR
jgi:predicted O-methyltransferase YrrM